MPDNHITNFLFGERQYWSFKRNRRKTTMLRLSGVKGFCSQIRRYCVCKISANNGMWLISANKFLLFVASTCKMSNLLFFDLGAVAPPVNRLWQRHWSSPPPNQLTRQPSLMNLSDFCIKSVLTPGATRPLRLHKNYVFDPFMGAGAASFYDLRLLSYPAWQWDSSLDKEFCMNWM